MHTLYMNLPSDPMHINLIRKIHQNSTRCLSQRTRCCTPTNSLQVPFTKRNTYTNSITASRFRSTPNLVSLIICKRKAGNPNLSSNQKPKLVLLIFICRDGGTTPLYPRYYTSAGQTPVDAEVYRSIRDSASSTNPLTESNEGIDEPLPPPISTNTSKTPISRRRQRRSQIRVQPQHQTTINPGLNTPRNLQEK